ncbi:MAG TPA: hypothetical protein VKD90_26010 [Gemmataceae bacterium]|nr:hypothetical protein [Gemmataceae bacterium]
MRWTQFAPAVAAGFLITPTLRAAPIADDEVRSKVDARVADWWLKPEEKRFDQIGWAPDLRTARKLSAEHDRPLFLFTMDGRVNTGRC